jgi:hypothetical protein
VSGGGGGELLGKADIGGSPIDYLLRAVLFVVKRPEFETIV